MSRRIGLGRHDFSKNNFKEQEGLKDGSVSKSILRGRAALEEAEKHIKLFEDYMKQSSKETKLYEEQENNGSSLHKHPLSLDNVNDYFSFSELNVTTNADHNSDNYKIEIDLIREMMREGQERQKRDHNIDLAHVGKDPIVSNRSNIEEVSRDKNDVKLKRKRAFDPKNLSVARRAIVKAAVVAEDIATKEVEQYKKSQFKARPLPGGAFVRNDPYALTKAALGKVSRMNGPDKINDSLIPIQTTRKDASELLNRTIQSSYERHERPSSSMCHLIEKQENTRREMKRKSVYKEISEKLGFTHSKDLNEAHSEVSSQQQQEDLATLHHQISRLQAELNLKRIDCIKTIEKIDNQDGDLSIFNEGSRSSKINMKSDYTLFDSLKVKRDEDTWTDDEKIKSPKIFVNNHKPKSPKSISTRNIETVKSSLSLYDRHNLWLQRIEIKRKEAKEREENELIKDVTGKPNLHGAQESWIKAKQQHDGLVNEMKSKASSRKTEKEAKERLLRERQIAEIEQLKLLSKQKNKARKNGIDKKKQAEYVDKLTRASAKSKFEFKAPPEERLKQSEPKIDKLEIGNEANKKDLKGNRYSNRDLSFADMDDKEFEKMIRKLKAKASKGKRTVFETNEDIVPASEASLCNENEIIPILNCQDQIGGNGKDHEEQKIDRFASSGAQAKILAEMSDVKIDSYQRKDDANSGSKNIERGCDVVINQSFRFPYERYKAGEIPFFDRSSSSEIGRFRVRDAREFVTDSLRRIPVPFKTESNSEGVLLLVGIATNKQSSEDKDVVTILFHRSHFDEISAAKWWQLHRSQIV